MSIRTTISINNQILENLMQLAETNGKSLSEIITKAVMFISSHSESFLRDRITTEYQQNDCEDFHIVHVTLSENVFDIALDLRRFSRASFSLLIAETISLYFKRFVFFLGNLDNYTGSVHCKIYYAEENVVCWKHIWGKPPERELNREKNSLNSA